MNVLDRARIEWAVLSYDFWLDLRGASIRRRRDLRRELRANLRDAAARSGGRGAVAALGSTRRMAAEASTEDATRPRWTAGAHSAFVALALTMLGTLIAATAWADGVMSADPDRPVSGSVTFLPGSSLEYAPVGEGFEISFTTGWAPVVVGLVVFVLVARPWRMLTGARLTVPR